MGDLRKLYQNCRLCPRNCGVDRQNGETGVCGADDKLSVARAALHFWEEPCISGTRGSGAVFFAGCPLRCIYCQNQEISRLQSGKEISVKRLSEIFFELDRQGAHNINLVTPTHYLPSILEAIEDVQSKGFSLPFVYNTSGYERPEMLRLLKNRVSIFLPDFKYQSPVLAKRFSGAADYFSYAMKAVDEMVRLAGPLRFGKDGILQSGVIIRHLILPEHIEESKKIIRYLFGRYGNDVYLSLMNQYTPVRSDFPYPELNRTLSQNEYDDVLDYAISIGVENAFIQEGGTAQESFIPPFDDTGV